VVESVKAASDVLCPVEGAIIAVNEELDESPEQINVNAYNEGWLFRMTPSKPGDVEELMNAEAYTELVESEEH